MAGANKPDGKSPNARVSFTRRDADRIARTVRTVEAGDKRGGGLTFTKPPAAGAGASSPMIRVATFTGSWGYETSKGVTFYNVTTTPNTVSAFNAMFADVYASGTNDVNCIIAKDGTAWHLVNVEHQINGNMLQDFNLTTAELRITRAAVSFVGQTTAAEVISVANCDTQVASVTSQSLFFG